MRPPERTSLVAVPYDLTEIVIKSIAARLDDQRIFKALSKKTKPLDALGGAGGGVGNAKHVDRA